MIRIIEGQSRKYIQGGQYSSVTADLPLALLEKGAFVAPSKTVGDERVYGDVGLGDRLSVYLNMVEGNREDVQEAGLAIIGGTPYTLETDIHDIVTPEVDEPVTVAATTATSGGKLVQVKDQEAGSYYAYGTIKSVTGTAGAWVITVSMSANNIGQITIS